ncbi:MAG: hypothetical protein ONB06_08055 [candidate division KSB1 bacterium]|nr:hypothetical protein [candidate division KSB1 bacterium]
MSKSNRLVLLVLLAASWVWAQSDRPITELVARHVRVDLSLSGAFVDLGASLAPLGGIASGQSDASCLSWNPAGLAALPRTSVVLDYVPGLRQDMEPLLHLSSRLREQMDAVIEDYGAPNALVTYPQLAARVGLEPIVGGVAVGLPLTIAGRRWGVGFGYREPFALRCTLLGTGVEVAIDSEEELEGEMRRIRMRTWLDVTGEAEARVQELIIGFGTQVGPATRVGLAVTRLALHARCLGYAAVEGIVEMSGGEYVFNDPYDPRIDFARGEQNNLHQSLFADYSGLAWGARIGLLHRLNHRLHLGLAINLPYHLRLHGQDSTVNNRIPFIDLEGGVQGEVADMIDATKIDLSKLTLTERLSQHNAFAPVLRVPGSLHLGVLWGTQKRALSARVSFYSGRLTASLKNGEERGMRLRYGVGVGFDLRYFFIGLGTEVGDEVQPAGETRAPMQALVVPRLNLGGRVPVASGLWLACVVGVEPTPLVRLSGQYEF